jgi:hypothetical protein
MKLMNENIALNLLQLVALMIPLVVVLMQVLRNSGNHEWLMRKWNFRVAITGVIMFIAGVISVLLYFFQYANVPMLLGAGLALTVLSILASTFTEESSESTPYPASDHENE